jgi:hypothetical protein
MEFTFTTILCGDSIAWRRELRYAIATRSQPVPKVRTGLATIVCENAADLLYKLERDRQFFAGLTSNALPTRLIHQRNLSCDHLGLRSRMGRTTGQVTTRRRLFVGKQTAPPDCGTRRLPSWKITCRAGVAIKLAIATRKCEDTRESGIRVGN